MVRTSPSPLPTIPFFPSSIPIVHLTTLNHSQNLRTQLKDTSIRVVEIVPPTVSTDLHRERSDPNDNKKDKNSAALSVDEFMEYVSKGWKEDRETVSLICTLRDDDK